MSRATLYRVFDGRRSLTAGDALALERLGWSNAEFWLRLQAQHDLAVLRREAAA